MTLSNTFSAIKVFCIFIQISLSKWLTDKKSVFVQVMAWHWTGDKPWSEVKTNVIPDAWCHMVSLDLNQFLFSLFSKFRNGLSEIRIYPYLNYMNSVQSCRVLALVMGIVYKTLFEYCQLDMLLIKDTEMIYRIVLNFMYMYIWYKVLIHCTMFVVCVFFFSFDFINPLSASGSKHCNKKMNMVNIDSGTGLVPDGTKPLPESMLIYCQNDHTGTPVSAFSVARFPMSIDKIAFKNISLKM